jgi:hypothetical protein
MHKNGTQKQGIYHEKGRQRTVPFLDSNEKKKQPPLCRAAVVLPKMLFDSDRDLSGIDV